MRFFPEYLRSLCSLRVFGHGLLYAVIFESQSRQRVQGMDNQKICVDISTIIYYKSWQTPTTKSSCGSIGRVSSMPVPAGPVSLLDRGVLLTVSWHGDGDQGSSPCSCAFLFVLCLR